MSWSESEWQRLAQPWHTLWLLVVDQLLEVLGLFSLVLYDLLQFWSDWAGGRRLGGIFGFIWGQKSWWLWFWLVNFGKLFWRIWFKAVRVSHSAFETEGIAVFLAIEWMSLDVSNFHATFISWNILLSSEAIKDSVWWFLLGKFQRALLPLFFLDVFNSDIKWAIFLLFALDLWIESLLINIREVSKRSWLHTVSKGSTIWRVRGIGDVLIEVDWSQTLFVRFNELWNDLLLLFVFFRLFHLLEFENSLLNNLWGWFSHNYFTWLQFKLSRSFNFDFGFIFSL